MIYILVALKNELPEHDLDETRYKVWYTGVGKVNAAMYATMAAAQPDCGMIINFGTAGVLNTEKDLVGKLNRVGLVKQRDMDARPQADLGVTPFDQTPYGGDIELLTTHDVSLSTGDNFVMNTPELESDLVDMEGYAIVRIAKLLEKPVVLMKYGSDFADENAAEEWEANQAKGKELFLEWLRDTDLKA